MYRRTLAYFLRTLMSLVAAGCLVIQLGGTSAVAAQLSQQQVSQFLTNSSGLIAANPDGGARLTASVRDLLLSDTSHPAVLNALITLLNQLNTDLRSATNDAQKLTLSNQITAIGAGMGQAAQSLASTDPARANQIQALLAASGVQLAIAAYLAETDNVRIAAGGGAGTGGGLATGAPAGGGGGGGGAPAANATASAGGGLTGGGGVVGLGASPNGPVSPQ